MMEFYDIHEQTPYQITVSKPENMEDLSDLFITGDELQDLVGRHSYVSDKHSTIILSGVITAAVKELTEKLEASNKKTIRIDDEELLEVLKENYLSAFTPQDSGFGRHGNTICYTRRYKRKKHTATQGDVTMMWSYLSYAFRNKFDTFPTHIPRYDRTINMFKAFKSIVGWRRVRTCIHDKKTVKFFRQIWDNPEEYIR